MTTTSCPCKEENGFWRNDRALDLSSPRQVQASSASLLLCDGRLGFIIRSNSKEPCQVWKFMMFRAKKRKCLTSYRGSFLRYETGKELFSSRSQQCLEREWKMVGGQPAETWRQLCPSQLGSQGTAAFLLRVKFPFPGFVFSAAEWDKHWYSTEQTESSVRLTEGLLATQTGEDEVGIKFTQPQGFAYSSFFLTLPKPCPLAIWAFASLWRLSHSLTALKLETSSSSQPQSITASSHPLAFVSTISPAYVLPLGLDSSQTSPQFH